MVYLDNFLTARKERMLKGKRIKSRHIVKGQRRERVLTEVIDALQDWRLSHFENEGAVHHGIRAALCLDGHGWALSDIEADLLVQQGLRTIGAKRPSWEQGQREYLVARENCSWCQAAIDEEDRAKGARFCSAVCARSAFVRREYTSTQKENQLALSAFDAIKTDEAPLIECSHCQKPFKRRGAQYASNLALGRFKFCSMACADSSKRVYAARNCVICEKEYFPRKERQFCCSGTCGRKLLIKPPNRECLCCGVKFRSYRSGDKANSFCSVACSNKFGRRTRIFRSCYWCGIDYHAKSHKSRSCGPQCAQRIVNVRNGAWKPKALTPHLLDFMCREVGISVTPDRPACLTAEIFDGWFKRAA